MINQFKAILGQYVETDMSEEKGESIATLKVDGAILEKIATHGIVKLSELNGMDEGELLEIEGISKKDVKDILESLGK